MASHTATVVVTKALKRLAILGAVEEASAEDSAAGLDALNRLMHGFNSEGVAYAHADLDAATIVNLGDHLIWALIDRLAERLAPDYGIVPPPALQAEFNRARRAMSVGLFVPGIARVDSALRRRRAGYYNIATDV